MKNYSRDEVSARVKEFMKSGKKPREAIAMALAQSRSASTETATDDGDEEFRSIAALNDESQPAEITNPESQVEAKSLAEAINEQDDVDYMSEGGLVEEHDQAMPTKEMPALMGDSLSEEAKAALMARKMNRRYSK